MQDSLAPLLVLQVGISNRLHVRLNHLKYATSVPTRFLGIRNWASTNILYPFLQFPAEILLTRYGQGPISFKRYVIGRISTRYVPTLSRMLGSLRGRISRVEDDGNRQNRITYWSEHQTRLSERFRYFIGTDLLIRYQTA